MSATAASRVLTTLPALVLSIGVLATQSTPASAAEEAICDPSLVPTSEALAGAKTTVNPAHQRMHVREAGAVATGRGTKVAVIDSGIAPAFTHVPLFAYPGTGPEMLSGHGTIVAGLIAGPDGVAPDATIYDVKVFDGDGADETEAQVPLTSAGIIAGIRAVIAAMPREQFDVVNLSLAVRDHDPRLEHAIADLVARDVVVVAAAGNKSSSEPAAGFTGTPDSDAEVYPADYPGVLAVSAVPPGSEDPATYVLPNRDTDVAAPSAGAISLNATGTRCVVQEVATSWAAAEVSGIVALLRERFPHETPQQIVARLQATTEGAGAPTKGTAIENPWTGAGVVQAHDALTRQIKPGRQGTIESTVAETRSDAQAPPAPEKVDLFGSSRALLLWFGLLAGTLLALAFMVRPLVRK